ncbi:MAG: phosphoribosylformylglycinamidine synthase subunit PurL [candidate division NC10 bacterium]|nr:phosphoribosylformylglycinamidine synthase subunit PurL [candidate division NC10 bacterium]
MAGTKELVITSRLIVEHGLTAEEYEKIRAILGREPNVTELGIFSVMWSEHCSYKSSRVHLQKLPTKGTRVLIGPGENAGVVDLGDNLAAVFKMESHNHPSFIEPYQGAATGVGGIIRDIFTMGARPIALLDSLRFGPLTAAKNRYLFSGVVAGISGYGNAVGVPTVGGECFFADCYGPNPLVNVLCLGIVRKGRIFKARAEGVGNPVIYVGARTGRDGIHGATMASEAFSEGSEERRPTVQVGDPFKEKCLIEACLELMETDEIVGIQDMGAAGLTCSTAEMAARGGVGVEVDLDQVPRREEGMTPYEVMLSESQERMLLVVKRGTEGKVKGIFEKWDLEASVVGQVTGDGVLRVKEKGTVVAEIPAKALVDGAPVYVRPMERPAYLDLVQKLDLSTLPLPLDYNEVLLTLLGSPNIGSKAMIFRQYDHMLYLNTVVLPGSDAVVLRVKGTRKGIALSCDGNGRYVYLDPYEGGKLAVAEAARNVVCSGAFPVAITNGLNFGSPEHPEIMWQSAFAVKGMAEACQALGTPVTGGNVSFYNETSGEAIFPTPIVGMLGVLEDISHATTQGFQKEGDLVVLLGETREELGGSEYLKVIHGLERGMPPLLDLGLEQRVQTACLEAIRSGLIASAHDCSDGGLAVALADSCISGVEGLLGIEVELQRGIRPDALLFGESQSRIVLSLREEALPALRRIADGHGVPLHVLGRVRGSRFLLQGSGFIIDLPVEAVRKAWQEALPTFFAR